MQKPNHISCNTSLEKHLEDQACQNKSELNTCYVVKAREMPLYPCKPSTVRLVVVLAVQDAQNRQEEVQDIQIQRNGGGDLLLNVIVAHNKLGVHEDITGEDQGTQHTVDELGGATKRHKHGHESEKDHEPQRAEEVGHPAGKVIFSLACEERERDKDAQCKGQGLHDNPGFVE